MNHPVLTAVDALRDALAGASEVPVELMSTPEKTEALVALSRLGDQITALRLRVLASADDVAVESGARDAGAWLAQQTRIDHGPARRDLRLGEALIERWTHLGSAMADGRVNEEQARVIASSLDALPDDVATETVAEAELHLIELAGSFAPKPLRALGRRILDVIAPEVGEAHEARLLADEERRAREATSLTFRAAGDGRTSIALVVPDAIAQRLRTYLDAYTSPRHDGAAGGDADRIPVHRRRGQAFCALLEAIDPRQLPMHGGDATTVVVTVGLEALRAELGTAGLIAEGETITASEARRLACTARLVPAVLGTESEILDLGRASRLFSPAQRKALRIRDRRCRAEGCTMPATWCEAHHRRPWARGGPTDLDDGVLLCSFHHHRAHDGDYVQTELPSGDLRFQRRRLAATG